MEGKDGVPLRFPRPVLALIATGTAAISIVMAAMPASADQVRPKEWWLSSLGVSGAWSASQGSGVTVAVLSDGVDASQADLTGVVTTAPAPSGAPVATGQYFGEQGTAIAGLIAGRGHGSGGGSGIVGVAPRARILSVPVTLPSGDPQLSQAAVATAIPSAIAAGIRYAVSDGATVIDLPIDPAQPGSSGTAGARAAAGGSAAEQAAVSYALAHNVMLVAPAGDDGTASDAPNYPAAYQGVIAVGAFNAAFNKAAWSSHSSYVTLTAAGVNVLAAASTGGYQPMNSTSAASAIVSGVVALIRSRYPSLSVADIRTALTTTTMYRRANGLATGSGYGAVNANNAMVAAADLGATPADRAGAGARPLVAPAAATATSATQGIGTQILKAGELSVGLLLLLLLVIALYAASGRRRPGGQPTVTAEWAHRQAQSRYPQAGGADADRMLELFAAPAPAPAGYRGQPAELAAAGFAGPSELARRADLADRADLTGRAGHPDADVFAPTADRQPAGASTGQLPTAGPPEPGRWLSHGPASRAVSRRAAVSGTPPWEPAAPPDSELPWVTAPGHHPGEARPVMSPEPRPPSQPDWLAGPAGHSLFEPGGHADAVGFPGAASSSRSGAVTSQPDWGSAGSIRASHTDWDAALTQASQPDWDASGRASQPKWGAQGQASLPDWDAQGHPSQPDWDAQGQASEPDWDVPNRASQPDWISPGQATPAGDHGSDSRTVEPADWGNGADWPSQPRTAASGLPVRPARSAMPPAPAPLSPSGSLWEPVDGDAGSYSGETEDAGRPIFVWNPAAQQESYPALPTELHDAQTDWGLPE